MSETVVFSQLSRKFIDENDATPDAAQQVVYYSLAIGHHLGVIDCRSCCRGGCCCFCGNRKRQWIPYCRSR